MNIEIGQDLNRALITGILGQDGIYLAKLLAGLGYEVHGITRKINQKIFAELVVEIPNLCVYEIDFCDSKSLAELIRKVRPVEIYTLAGFSSVQRSWNESVECHRVNAKAFEDLIEIVKNYSIEMLNNSVRIYQASSSELFGSTLQTPQDETTEFKPISPYGISKLEAHLAAQKAVDNNGIFVACGILFNHESPYRSPEFITRKISQAVARVSLNLPSNLTVGNIEASRDWGFAGDYVIAMWKMLQQPNPESFVIATGVSTSIRELISLSFNKIGVSEWQDFVTLDENQQRPSDPMLLVGNPSKAQRAMDWKAQATVSDLMDKMIESDIRLLVENK